MIFEKNFKSFNISLKEKYSVTKSYIFIGFINSNKKMYADMEKMGYDLIFKETFGNKNYIKGNIDTDLVLHAILKISSYDNAVIVSGDGDFFSLAKHLKSINKLERFLIPNERKYSHILDKLDEPNVTFLSYINREKNILEYKNKKPPHETNPIGNFLR